MREVPSETKAHPQHLWRCVTELGFPSVTPQRLLHTGRELQVLTSHPDALRPQAAEQPILLGERAVRLAMEKLGIREHDADAHASLTAELEQLRSEVEELREYRKSVWTIQKQRKEMKEREEAHA